jgi:hypothetical protein
MSSATCALLNTKRVVDPRLVLPSVGDKNHRSNPKAAAKYRCLFAAELKYDGRPLVSPLATRYVPSNPPVVPLMMAAPQIGHACVLQLIVTDAATNHHNRMTSTSIDIPGATPLQLFPVSSNDPSEHEHRAV